VVVVALRLCSTAFREYVRFVIVPCVRVMLYVCRVCVCLPCVRCVCECLATVFANVFTLRL
jgi:hypothetical protein